ncbi:MAG: rod shape-determining protein MreD [Candidatus Omnitrophica bacterium CG11_big_fil_rev_8_21_14_0_20_45_26]|uniref:Rod shape-determining protein MreD n=1 Tax=Candidatus Abzuiibacterium crystallinum TaxID=1974748 RepID=A0A2H0LP03_9BACT|nr:MAG: rod shape-determining protein MreD [Candidatus Omnitrophica bacterium CG11_big_fil_rev_8_21_14_0_20_45_26]PIW65268.1 MAG: rod shape-determining protein MreD [Candidatus Omnitrophica bacterium CG12_big_fil_rev_8_21_14_0_65_45_16]
MIIKWFKWKIFFLAILFICIQMTLVHAMAVGRITPDLLLLWLAFYAFLIDYHWVVAWAFLLGLMKDLLVDSHFGLETISLIGGALVLYQIAKRFDRYSRLVHLWGTFVFCLVTLFIFAVLHSVVSERFVLNQDILIRILGITVYTTLISPVFFFIFRFVFKINPKKKQYELF